MTLSLPETLALNSPPVQLSAPAFASNWSRLVTLELIPASSRGVCFAVAVVTQTDGGLSGTGSPEPGPDAARLEPWATQANDTCTPVLSVLILPGSGSVSPLGQ